MVVKKWNFSCLEKKLVISDPDLGCANGENGMVKFLETFADNVFSRNYSMMQIFFKLNYGKILGLPRPTPLNEFEKCHTCTLL
jgi:hypothetical protein